MKAERCTEADLRRELEEFQERFPNLSDDDVFVLWFLRAFVTDAEEEAVNAVCGGPKDKGVDAALIDEGARVVVLVQGKFRQRVGGKAEHRPDVTSFAELAPALVGEMGEYKRLTADISPEVLERLDRARNCILKRGYSLRLYFVTTGRCSPALCEEAEKTAARATHGNATLEVIDGKRVLLLLADYLAGVAPPVPSLDLELEPGRSARGSGVLNRYDPKTDIDSWVFSMTDRSVAELFQRARIRLFARNVRGFLGNTAINRGMEDTLEREPEHFWYYNNGITIVCDAAELKTSHGREVLRVANPQVINGQQTTRTLARAIHGPAGASVLMRVIRVPRESPSAPDRFEELVSRIVAATNWQNAIRPSDLMANDRVQIQIERQLRKLGYWYLRKRQTKQEARRAGATRKYHLIKKEVLAQAIAACEMDPSIVRTEGKEGLFEERLYPRVFPTADPLFYLTRYGLLREVSYAARGYPERAYSKWVVQHFLWSEVSGLLRGRAIQQAFASACGRNGAIANALYKANVLAFRAARTFYQTARKGRGEKAQDVSNFFRRRGLDAGFRRYWRRSRNQYRQRFKQALRRLSRELEKAA